MVKKYTGVAKRNNEIKIAREAKNISPGFFQMYRTITWEKIESLKANAGEGVENYESMSTLWNDYLLSLCTQEDRRTTPERVQVHEGREGNKLRAIIITRQVVQDEIDT